MPKPKTPPPLVGALGLLGKDWQARLREFALAAQPACRHLEPRFRRLLSVRGFDPRQRKALQLVTAGAAVATLAGGAEISTFLEEVDYQGRRLAKLGLPPRAVLEILFRYDRLLEAELRRQAPAEAAAWRPVRQQLDACIAITLNNAYYQVRAAETHTFFELGHVELESKTEAELLERSAEALRRYCQAEAGRLVFANGALPGPRRLSRPRYLTLAGASEELLIEPAWRQRYHAAWSIPLAPGWPAGLMQFAFSKPYEWLPRELQLLEAAGERCRLAADKARLMEELAARERQVRDLAAHMLQVEEVERRRISRELHDEAGQLLLYLRLHLERLEGLAPPAPPELHAELAQARRLVEQTIVEIRRLLGDLSPAVLAQLGLAAALRQLVSRFRALHSIPTRLRLGRLGRLDPRVETVVYRLLQECLNNIARHSSARSVQVFLETVDSSLRLRVRDDGVGFDVEEALSKPGSFGLAGMRERVLLLGGIFTVHSRPGRGTTIAVQLPLTAPERPSQAPPDSPRPAPGARARRFEQRG